MVNMDFYEAVVRVVRSIPAGEVLTYAQVAHHAGYERAYRAVGNVLKHNFDDSIPCHRVVPGSYKLGAYNRGKWAKLIKLSQEGYKNNLIPRYYTSVNIDYILKEIASGSIGLLAVNGSYSIVYGDNLKAQSKLKKMIRRITNIDFREGHHGDWVEHESFLEHSSDVLMMPILSQLDLGKVLLSLDCGKTAKEADKSLEDMFNIFEDNLDFYIGTNANR